MYSGENGVFDGYGYVFRIYRVYFWLLLFGILRLSGPAADCYSWSSSERKDGRLSCLACIDFTYSLLAKFVF